MKLCTLAIRISQFPKKWTLALPGRVHLQLSPVNLAYKISSAAWGAPPGYVYGHP